MASLSESNEYLRNREARHRMVGENTFDSSVFEGASPSSLGERVKYQSSGNRRSKASAKKQDKAS